MPLSFLKEVGWCIGIIIILIVLIRKQMKRD